MIRKCLILTVLVALLLSATPAYTQTETGPLAGHKICLDPGHGGSDPGAVNETYQLHESGINLDVAYGLKALLEGDGATVVMTRTDDRYLDNSDRYTYCNNEHATLLISVHTNSTTDPSMDGSMALYFHNDDKVLAQAVLETMYGQLQPTAPEPDTFTNYGLDRFASGVLLKSDMPATITEPLMMSHPDEAAILVTPIYDASGAADFSSRRGQIAQAIHDGILAYAGVPGDTPTDAAPTVSITAPADGATVAGTVDVTADATDDHGVSQVEFFVDDGSIGVDNDGTDGWSASWDTTAHADGSHTVSATATDTAGQTSSAEVKVTVDNVSADEPTGMTVTSIMPNTGQVGTTVDVTVDGSGFAEGADLTLEGGAGPAPAVSEIIVAADGTSLTATVTIPTGGPPKERVWDVRVTNPDGTTDVLKGSFTVTTP